MSEELGDRIRELRGMRGLTQKALAERAGVSAEAIHKWEHAKTSPRAKNLEMLAEALEVSMRAFDTSVPLDYALRDEWREGEKWLDPRRRREERGDNITLRFRGRVVFEWERDGIRILKIEEPEGCCQLVLIVDIDREGSRELRRSIHAALNQPDSYADQ